jgi:hypothetical protein
MGADILEDPELLPALMLPKQLVTEIIMIAARIKQKTLETVMHLPPKVPPYLHQVSISP